MKINFDTHGGNIDKEARKLGLSTKNIIDASASLVPFKLPKRLTNYLVKSINKGSLRHYPDRSYFEIKNAISKFHKIDPSMILPGNGASELFTWAARDAGKSLVGMPFLKVNLILCLPNISTVSISFSITALNDGRPFSWRSL